MCHWRQFQKSCAQEDLKQVVRYTLVLQAGLVCKLTECVRLLGPLRLLERGSLWLRCRFIFGGQLPLRSGQYGTWLECSFSCLSMRHWCGWSATWRTRRSSTPRTTMRSSASTLETKLNEAYYGCEIKIRLECQWCDVRVARQVTGVLFPTWPTRRDTHRLQFGGGDGLRDVTIARP